MNSNNLALQSRFQPQSNINHRMDRFENIISGLGFEMPIEDKDVVYSRYVAYIDAMNNELATAFRDRKDTKTVQEKFSDFIGIFRS